MAVLLLHFIQRKLMKLLKKVDFVDIEDAALRFAKYLSRSFLIVIQYFFMSEVITFLQFSYFVL